MSGPGPAGPAGEDGGASVYDAIGRGYAATRRDDPRIAARVHAALGGARRIVNVGAGTGSYEPAGGGVVAVEPSREMIRQRRAGAAPVVQAIAERLPFRDRAFDAALATLTVHHWHDREAGLRECRRVAARVVVLTWDPARTAAFWLTAEYFPEIDALDAGRFPALAELAAALGPIRVEPVPVPRDCADGFLGAFWARPEAYLDPAVRRAMSGFARLPGPVVDAGLARLAADLGSGAWDRRHRALRGQAEADLGYRLVVAEAARDRDRACRARAAPAPR